MILLYLCFSLEALETRTRLPVYHLDLSVDLADIAPAPPAKEPGSRRPTPSMTPPTRRQNLWVDGGWWSVAMARSVETRPPLNRSAGPRRHSSWGLPGVRPSPPLG